MTSLVKLIKKNIFISRGVSILLILSGGISGCSTEYFTPVETYEFKNQKPENIKNVRFYNYNFSYNDYNFGENPPSSITTYNRESYGESRHYIKNQFNTSEYKYKYRFEVIALVFYIIFISLLYLFVFFSIIIVVQLFFKGKKLDSNSIPIAIFSVLLSVILIFPTCLFGYLSGSIYYIDNASNKKVNLYINDDFCSEIPAGSFVQTRIFGSEILLTIKDSNDKQTIESINLHADGTNELSIIRYFFHKGSYIYNIRGYNTINFDYKNYHKR